MEDGGREEAARVERAGEEGAAAAEAGLRSGSAGLRLAALRWCARHLELVRRSSSLRESVAVCASHSVSSVAQRSASLLLQLQEQDEECAGCSSSCACALVCAAAERRNAAFDGAVAWLLGHHGDALRCAQVEGLSAAVRGQVEAQGAAGRAERAAAARELAREGEGEGEEQSWESAALEEQLPLARAGARERCAETWARLRGQLGAAATGAEAAAWSSAQGLPAALSAALAAQERPDMLRFAAAMLRALGEDDGT